MAFCLNQRVIHAYGEKMKNSRLLISLFFACCLIFSSWMSVFADSNIIKSSSIAMNGDPKYPKGFSHFEYVNPGAPKGGTVKLSSIGSYDSFNALSLKVFLQADWE